MASCNKDAEGADTTIPEHYDTAPTFPDSQTTAIDNRLFTDNGGINFTPSDYRIVDETDFGFVIIIMDASRVTQIHKITAFESSEKAHEALMEIVDSGTIEDYPGLKYVDNFHITNIGLEDETYGKFYTMSRKDVLKAFNRNTDTSTEEAEHTH